MIIFQNAVIVREHLTHTVYDLRALKKAEVLSVYRKILYKNILTESTTTLIAVVGYTHKCKGPERKPTPPSQSSVMGCADKPFIISIK